VLRFGDCELDIGAFELRRKGQRVALERQPMELLILLVARRGQLVTRAEIGEHIWGKDVFVDVETGVHTAMRKIRRALGDSTDAPVFVETVAGKGYRFIAPVEVVSGSPAPAPPPAPSPPPDSVARASRRPGSRALFLIAALALFASATAAVLLWNRSRTPAPVTLAVLPFENLSGSRQHDYLANGLAEETIVSLGQIDPPRLRVLGRTSTLGYRGTRKSLTQIGKELGADYLVESTLLAERDRVRVTSRLVRAADQTQVWSSAFDRSATTLLGLQGELSAAIAEQIHARLRPERMAALSRRHTANPDAYHFYLRGLEFWSVRTPSGNQQAIAAYRRATAIDPQYALAWAALSVVYASSPINGDARPQDVAAAARESADRAVAAEPNLSEARYALGYVQWLLEWRWPAAEANLRRAVQLDPGSWAAHLTLGHCLSQMGRHSEALIATRRARELDPLSPVSHAMSAQVALQARDYRAAADYAQQAIVISPDFWIGYVMRAQAMFQLGRREEALADLQRAARLSEGNSKAVSLRGYVLARSGRTDEARAVLARLDEISRERYVPPYAIALVHAGLGQNEAMFQALGRALEDRDGHLIFLPVDPLWDEYRSDPRFKSIISRAGFTDLTARSER
jgi:TolB-like protein/DNA-binding winged helix-turn-helix (wHTH) protein/Flp pilus assembly protein TadD